MKTLGFSGKDLSQLQQQLAAWRRRQPGRPRLPQPLWDAAAELARLHGVSRVAQTLRLDYYRLQRRVNSLPTRSRVSTTGVDSGFVELKLIPPALAANQVGAVELSSGTQRRLRIETGFNPTAWVALAESFWRSEV